MSTRHPFLTWRRETRSNLTWAAAIGRALSNDVKLEDRCQTETTRM